MFFREREGGVWRVCGLICGVEPDLFAHKMRHSRIRPSMHALMSRWPACSYHEKQCRMAAGTWALAGALINGVKGVPRLGLCHRSEHLGRGQHAVQP